MGREAVVVAVGARVFTDTLSILMLAICLPIHLAGLSAARLCGAIVGYPAADRGAMCALPVPQVAATLAVALVAYGARNTTGEHLIDQAIANAAIVLAVVTSLGGLLPAGRAAAAMSGPQPAAPKTPTTGQMAMWPLRRHVVPDMELP